MMESTKEIEFTGSSTVPQARPICSFWGRLLALGVDLFLLFGVGSLLGRLFGNRLAQLGVWGWLVGFVLVLVYFGLLNSRVGQGQTLGKRLLRVRVVGVDGEQISPARSLLRAAILGALYFLNASIAGDLSGVINGVVLGLGLGGIYLYLCNRMTRQSLHDLVARTCVVRSDAAGPISLGTLARLHYIGIGLLVVLGVGWHTGIPYIPYASISDLRIVQEKLNQVNGISRVGLETGASYGGPTPQHGYLVTTVTLDHASPIFEQRAEKKIAAAGDTTSLRLPPSFHSAKPPEDIPLPMRLLSSYISFATARLSPPSLAYFEAVTEEIDRIVLENYPGSADIDKRTVLVNYGYNIGITLQAFVQVERRWVPHRMNRTGVRWGVSLP